MGKLTGKVAVVTGASKGIGASIAVQGDVSKSKDIERLFAETKAEHGRLDILVNKCRDFRVRSS